MNWKWIVGYEGSYQISDHGDVVSLIYRHRVGERVSLVLMPDKDGYLRVGLWDGVKQHTHSVHQEVLLAFVGLCPDGCEPNHKNGRKSDNHLTNLEYKTKQYNIEHSRRVLGKCVGERHGCSKFSNAIADSIKADLKTPMPRRAIAEKYSCSLALVKAIRSGRLRQSDHVVEVK